MVQRAGVNKLHTTAAQISVHIRDFAHDANILHSVKGLEEIIHHTPLNHEDEEWLVRNRMAFSVSNYSPSVYFLPANPRSAPVHVWYHRGATGLEICAGLANTFVDPLAAD